MHTYVYSVHGKWVGGWSMDRRSPPRKKTKPRQSNIIYDLCVIAYNVCNITYYLYKISLSLSLYIYIYIYICVYV